MTLYQWTPTLVAVATLIGLGFVAQSTLQRHEADLAALRQKHDDEVDALRRDLSALETEVAVLKATRRGGE